MMQNSVRFFNTFQMSLTSDAKLMDHAEEILEGMLMGFSVAVYGCGSKIKTLDCVLETIKANACAGDKIVRIRGYDQNFPIVRTLSAGILGAVKRNIIRTQADVIKNVDKLPKMARVFLLVDSIDGAPLRNHQDFLSELAKRPNVFLCASVDHCKVGLMWSPAQFEKFRWIWLESSTYMPYTAEVKDLVPFWRDVIEGKTDAASRSVQVLNSLTGSHSEIVQILAGLQLKASSTVPAKAKKTKKENSENQDPQVGSEAQSQVKATDLLKQCVTAMIADNQQKMRALLQELIDHRLVLNAKDKETGNEMFWLPFDRERLEQLAAGNLK